MTRFRIDVDALKARLLAEAETLVLRWLPAGKKAGKYVKFGSVDGEAGSSAWVNLETGAWRDEASADEGGGDLISLYAAVRCGGDNAQALRELAREYGMLPADDDRQPMPPAPPPPRSSPPAAPPPADSTPKWVPVHPVPDDAPDYRTQWGHYARGIPKLHWEYRDRVGQLLGVVCRFEASDGSKDVQPLSFCVGKGGRREWRYHGFLEPRPLYGLDRMPDLDSDESPLLIVVEGEKCADALWEALDRTIPVLAWPGGGKAVRRVDWSPVAGRRLLCWPDADLKIDKRTGELFAFEDQPGMRAMRGVEAICTEKGCAVRLVDIRQAGEVKDGWDCADAIEEGWDRTALLTFMQRHLPPAPEVPPAAAGDGGNGGASTPPEAARAEEPPDEVEPWRERLIWRNKYQLRECTPNVIEVLTHRPEWKGVIGYNEFADRIVKCKPPPYDELGVASRLSDEWSDVDDTRSASWIAHAERFVPSSSMVAEAVNVVARGNAFHPVLQYLRGLPAWDGTDRCDHWLIDYLHVEDVPYTRLVSRWYLMGMVARVLQPGVKFDYCLVLEGKQGRFKSTALRILAGEWFSDIELDLANKDAMSNIRGKWLHEFGEMGSIARSESTRQKSFLSRQYDEFRPAYGRREIRCPRQLVFAGTTNEWQWNKDPTGGRRFWPVDVPDEVNTEGLQAARDQLFAEAYARVLAGERFYPNGQEQRELFDPEQLSREAPNAFTEILARWLVDPANVMTEFTLADAIQHGLKIDAKGITRDLETRVGSALHKLGCEKFERRNAPIRHWYKRPQRNAASSVPDQARAEAEEALPV